tara:strand:+ start:975 stop:1193 length:219 start_codon:yes stop_codon:yes gene_type:complete
MVQIEGKFDEAVVPLDGCTSPRPIRIYGSNPPLEALANTNPAILNIIPSEGAKRVAMAPELEAAMQEYGKSY